MMMMIIIIHIWTMMILHFYITNDIQRHTKMIKDIAPIEHEGMIRMELPLSHFYYYYYYRYYYHYR